MPKPENQKHDGRIIRDEIPTSASPQHAWEAWADPQKIAQWFVDRAEGKAEPGGKITWFFDKFNLALNYDVLEAVPGDRYTVKWPGPMPPPGILEVIIERDGGETLIRLVQSGFREGAEWDEEYQGVASGWHTSLALLRHYLENYFGRPRTTILVMQPAQFDYDQVAPYFRKREFLAQWLTGPESAAHAIDGAIGDEVDACRLKLRGGETLNGHVLARTSRQEVSMSWPEQKAVVELKAFSMGPQRFLGVRISGWDMTPETAAKIEKEMSAAVARLVDAIRKSAAA
jgi:uncharacterized protein YndB with AHSA1/START domain